LGGREHKTPKGITTRSMRLCPPPNRPLSKSPLQKEVHLGEGVWLLGRGVPSAVRKTPCTNCPRVARAARYQNTRGKRVSRTTPVPGYKSATGAIVDLRGLMVAIGIGIGIGIGYLRPSERPCARGHRDIRGERGGPADGGGAARRRSRRRGCLRRGGIGIRMK